MRRPGQRVRDVFVAAVAGIERRADLDRAWAEATELATTVEGLTTDVTALRSRLARRIAKQEALSLTALADRLSLSKSRAFQLTRDDNPDA